MADNHHNNQPNPDQLLFVMGMFGNGNQYFLIGPDNYTKTLNPPASIRNLTHIRVLNCVNGYLCFYGYDVHSLTYKLVMWNPIDGTTLPEVTITPNEGNTRPVIGCGVCRFDGPKIVRISAMNNAVVYTVSTGEWRNVEQDMPFGLCVMECAKVCVNGQFIYMRAYSRLPDGKRCNFFTSFDFEREVFGVVPLPERFSKKPIEIESVKVSSSLGLLEYHDGCWDVWTMEENANGTFSWLSGRPLKGTAASVIAFRNNGEPVMPKVKVGGSEVTLSAVRPLS